MPNSRQENEWGHLVVAFKISSGTIIDIYSISYTTMK
jgi:hypothetical protein